MSFLSNLFRRKAVTQNPLTENTPEPKPFVNEQAAVDPDDPVQFADWIFEHVVSMMGEDFASSIDEENRERLQISESECKAYGNEAVIMLGLGACIFTGQNFAYESHKAFKRSMAVSIAKRLYGGHVEYRIEALEQAFDSYLQNLIDGQNRQHLFTEFSAKYIGRVFPNNPNANAMFTGASIARVPLDLALSSFKVTQDGYCRLKHGMGYEALNAIEKALEESEPILQQVVQRDGP